MRKALITGITGQDGSYLAELLLEKGYAVTGLLREMTDEPHAAIVGRVELLKGDLCDEASLHSALAAVQPDEIYHLAAQSVPRLSIESPLPTANANGLGTLRMLEAVRTHCPEARFFHASTSEVFANSGTSPQNEDTAFAPRDPYGASKVFGQTLTAIYRDTHGLHASSGIMYNHESPRRGRGFVTRKITRAVAEIALGLREVVELGDLDARRDWGFAGDYVQAMWAMLQAAEPQDYVIGSGITHSVRDFCESAFTEIGRDYRDHVVRNPALARSPERTLLQSDPSRASAQLGWSAQTSFKELVSMMVQADMDSLQATT